MKQFIRDYGCPKVQYRFGSLFGRVLAMSSVRHPRRPNFDTASVLSIDFRVNSRPAALADFAARAGKHPLEQSGSDRIDGEPS